MSYRQDRRTPADKDWGKPQVNYPYGLPDFPEIIETKTARQTQKVPASLAVHPDFPNAFLTEYRTDAGGNRDANWWMTYETLPGPIFVEEDPYRDTAVPMLTARQQIAATTAANYTTGEFQPSAVNVSSITDNGDGTCTVTLSASHNLPPLCWVIFAGTNSTPNIDGNKRIISVPSPTQVIVAAMLTGAGTAAGTMKAINWISRSLKPIPNKASVLVKIDTMVAVPDVTVYNESVKCWKDYEFPDHLKAINFYNDTAATGGTATYNSQISWGGAVGLPMQDGYHGPCRATRKRHFFVGPPPDSFEQGLAPTFIMPSSGTFVIKGGSTADSYTPDLSGYTSSTSNSFRTGRIPHSTTGPNPAATTIGGGGQATVSLDLPVSNPPRFFQEQIIILLGQPVKYDAGALWEIIEWDLECPYTSGFPPGDFVYTTNPASYVHGSAIATNSPSGLAGASAFSISPGLSSGLSINSSTGAITGTPASALAEIVYTISCTVAGKTQKAYLSITIT